MLQITWQSKIFLATESVDGRKGIDGLAALCQQKLSIDPMNGALFVFRNRQKNAFKIYTTTDKALGYVSKGYPSASLNGGLITPIRLILLPIKLYKP